MHSRPNQDERGFFFIVCLDIAFGKASTQRHPQARRASAFKAAHDPAVWRDVECKELASFGSDCRGFWSMKEEEVYMEEKELVWRGRLSERESRGGVGRRRRVSEGDRKNNHQRKLFFSS